MFGIQIYFCGSENIGSVTSQNVSYTIPSSFSIFLILRIYRLYIHIYKAHLLFSPALLGPMRYTSCELLGNRCAHHPRPMLHFFGISVKFYRHDLKLMCDSTKHSYIDIYGLIAVRDSLDFARNTIFHCSRENAQAIDLVITYSFSTLSMIIVYN
jgi:hypothetical protein